jgi:hypothetical protein
MKYCIHGLMESAYFPPCFSCFLASNMHSVCPAGVLDAQYNSTLQLSGSLRLYWSVNFETSTINFAGELRGKGYISFGFVPRSEKRPPGSFMPRAPIQPDCKVMEAFPKMIHHKIPIPPPFQIGFSGRWITTSEWVWSSQTRLLFWTSRQTTFLLVVRQGRGYDSACFIIRIFSGFPFFTNQSHI